jgi:hypothetical protein
MANDYAALVAQEARRQGIDPAWAVATMQQESSGRPNVVSPAGAQGLMQLMPQTAKDYGVTNPFDPMQNIRAGVSLLKDNLAKTGSMSKASAAYYAGFHNTYNPDVHRYVQQVAQKFNALAPQYPVEAKPVADNSQNKAAMDALNSMFGAPENAPASNSDKSALDALNSMFAAPPTAPQPKQPTTISGNADLTKTPSILNDIGVGMQDVAQPIENAAQNAASWVTGKLGLTGTQQAIKANQGKVNAQIEADRSKAEPGTYGQIARAGGQIAMAAPLLTAGGEVAGGALGGAGEALGGNVGNALRVGGNVVRGAVGPDSGLLAKGATYAANGAIQGAGFNAMTGANPLSGAVAGAIGAPVLAGAGHFIGGAAQAAGDLLRSPENRAVAQTYRALLADGFTPQAAMARMQQMGQGATLADAAGQNTLRLADSATVAGGPAAQTAREVLASRAENRAAQLAKAVSDATGQTGAVHDTVQGLIAQRSQEAAPLYAKVADIVPTADQLKPVMPFLESPRGQAALKDGIQILQDEALKAGQRFDPAQYGLSVGKDGSLAIAPDAKSFPLLQAAKEGFDDMVEGARDSVTGKLPNTKAMNALSGVRDSYRKALTDAFPEYKSALDAWAGPSAAIDAVNMGRNALKNDSEVTAKVISGLPDSQKEFYLQGVTRALMDQIETNPKATVSKILRNKLFQNRIRAAFNSDSAYNGFIKSIENQGTMQKTENMLNRGSPTAQRQVDQGNLMGSLATVGRSINDLGRGNIGNALWHAGHALNIGADMSPTGDALANILINPDLGAVGNALTPNLSAAQQHALAVRQIVPNMLTNGVGRAVRTYAYPALKAR